jgi:hypothetical protein
MPWWAPQNFEENDQSRRTVWFGQVQNSEKWRYFILLGEEKEQKEY